MNYIRIWIQKYKVGNGNDRHDGRRLRSPASLSSDWTNYNASLRILARFAFAPTQREFIIPRRKILQCVGVCYVRAFERTASRSFEDCREGFKEARLKEIEKKWRRLNSDLDLIFHFFPFSYFLMRGNWSSICSNRVDFWELFRKTVAITFSKNSYIQFKKKLLNVFEFLKNLNRKLESSIQSKFQSKIVKSSIIQVINKSAHYNIVELLICRSRSIHNYAKIADVPLQNQIRLFGSSCREIADALSFAYMQRLNRLPTSLYVGTIFFIIKMFVFFHSLFTQSVKKGTPAW